MKTISQRMGKLPGNFFVEFTSKIVAMEAAGHNVIRLDIGSPDMPPATHIMEALNKSAAAPDHHGYQPHAGPASLRQAWSAMYQRVFRVEINPDREIVPLIGSKEGIFNLMMAMVDAGDIVLIPNPSYVTYTRGTIFAGGEPYYLPLLPERDYLPDLGRIPETVANRAKVLWLNYPNNPTAATSTSEFFTEAVAFARQHDVLLCHDAAYTQITYDGYHAPSILEIPGAKEVAIEFNTLSKSHNMAGWRVGAAIGQAQVLRDLFKLKTNIDSSHFWPIMDGATVAMLSDQNWLADRNEIYRLRRDVIIWTLHALGLHASNPRASLYVWCPTPKEQNSLEFANALLDEAKISLTPGIVFGEHGEGYVRISLTAPLERIEQAMRRLTNWMKR